MISLNMFEYKVRHVYVLLGCQDMAKHVYLYYYLYTHSSAMSPCLTF